MRHGTHGDMVNFNSKGPSFSLRHHESNVLNVASIEGKVRLFQVASKREMEVVVGDDYVSPLSDLLVRRNWDQSLVQILFPRA